MFLSLSVAITNYCGLGDLYTIEIYFSPLWRVEVQDQSVNMVGSPSGSLLFASSYGGKGEKALRGYQPPIGGSHTYDLITSHRVHLLIRSHGDFITSHRVHLLIRSHGRRWGLRFQMWIWREHKHSVHNNLHTFYFIINRFLEGETTKINI